MQKDTTKATGKVTFKLLDKDGNVKEERTIPNLVVNIGLSVIANRLHTSATDGAMSHMGVGTSSTAAAAAQTDLIAITGPRRALTSQTIVTETITDDSIDYVGTFPAGASTGALVEAGIFNALTVGQMLARTTFGVINKAASDSLIITWRITLS